VIFLQQQSRALWQNATQRKIVCGEDLKFASAFALAFCGPVMAADILEPGATTEWTWQGFYAGAFGAGT
jgi:hypothetical protein